MKVVEIFKSIDGEGIRVGYPVTFIRLAGCNLRCNYCDTKYSYEDEKFTEMTPQEIYIQVYKLGGKRITLTGGDPLEPKNVNQALEFIMLAKSKNKTVWVYTGYLYEQIKDMYPGLITLIDVLCDGPFIQSLKSPEKPWVGSSNQRVIDVQESLRQNKVVLV